MQIQTKTSQKSKKRNDNIGSQKMPWVIPSLCESCNACVNRCPRGCLQMVQTELDGFEVPWIENPENCSGCGRCEQSCVIGAINMTAYKEAAISRFRSRAGLNKE